MHCFLRDCYSSLGARLRCVCDRTLYGARVLSGLYWYDEGLQGAYKPPPPSWVDVVPMQSDDNLEAYTMDGVDDEIDLTLYQQAVGAAAPSEKPAAWQLSRRDTSSNGTQHHTSTKGVAYSEWTSLVTLSSKAAVIPLGLGIWKKTRHLLTKNESPRIAKEAWLLNQTNLIRNISTMPNTSKAVPERDIAARIEKSKPEKDLRRDAKFLYEDYMSFEDGATSGLMQSSAISALGSTGPLWIVACHYAKQNLLQHL
ncbi:uncharacterized protein LOC142768405 [Rhipicephalus microplus]|uniref:uncharacterized protein LOC142768405 n=1 Tax=Rhipicephalus microplus TaxID=6941 RepID=UPI003F6BA017